MRLKGKRALVTGGARGIGQGIAEKFLLEGARVIILDYRADELAETVKALKQKTLAQQGGEQVSGIDLVVCDLKRPDQIEQAAEFSWNLWGGLDILVNNAGIAVREPFTDIPYSRWQEIMDVNLNGMFLLSQQIVKRMIAGKIEGSIVNMTSKNGLTASAMLAHYNASKGGIVLLTQSMCTELAGYGIRVNAVAPGFIDTPLDRELKQKAGAASVELTRTPMRRCGTVEEVAHAVLFLASDEASYITGTTLVVDGGHLANAGQP